MNCERFQEILLEYVDDALSPAEKAAAQAHLGECSSCRELVQDEWLTRQVLSGRLREAVEPVTLDAHTKRRMAAAIRKQIESTPESKKTSVFATWMFHLLIPASAACLILIFAIWLGHSFIRPRDPSATISPGPVVIEIPVHASYSALHYTFRQEGAMVVDALTSDTRVTDGTLLAKR